MKKPYLVALFLFPVLLLAGFVSAQTTTRPNVVGRDLRQQVEQKRIDFRQQLETRQAERVKLQADRRATLEERLSVIKDERKQQATLRLNDQLQTLNTRILKHFSDLLDRQAEILARIVARIDAIEATGRNVTQARADIAQAESAITKARAAILAQTTKTYQIQITTEANLKRDVGATRQTLQQDLQTVRATVRAVHEALRLIMTNLAGIMGNRGNATTSPTATSTN